MAAKTFFVLGTAVSTWGALQDGGTAPTAANSAFGFTPSTTALTTPFYRGRLGAAASNTAALAASYVDAATGPVVGTGTTIATAGDSFTIGPYTGTFVNTAWTFAWNMRAGTAGAIGQLRMRVWASVNSNGTSSRELTAGAQVGAIITLSTTVDHNSSISWSPGAITLNNEFLFFQLEWKETTLSGTSGASVFFRINTATITTPNFVDAAVFAATEDVDTASFAASSNTTAALAATEVADTASFAASTNTTSALAATEAVDTASLAASTNTTAVLAATEAPDTATFATSTASTAVLAATESPDVAAFAGSTNTTASLAATEDSDAAVFSASVGTSISDDDPIAIAEFAVAEELPVATSVSAVLAATEDLDTATFTAQVQTTAVLAATEDQDTAAFAASTTATAALAAVEDADTAAFQANSTATAVTAVLDATEDSDTAEFFADNVIPFTGGIYTVSGPGVSDAFPISGVSAVPNAGLGVQRRTA